MDSRRKVIDAAKQMFWHHGYSTTSPKQVMASSDVGQGSFYHHFPTKAALGREVVAENGRDLLESVRAEMAGRATGRERLESFLSSAGEALGGCPVGGFAYDAGILGDPELRAELSTAFERLTGLVEQTVREGQDDGSVPAGLDPTRTAAALVAGVEGAFLTARATGRQSTADEAMAGLLDLLLRSH